jgi:cytochrome c-type biogenesis protein CcmH/NrfG
LEEATDCFRRALAVNPNYLEAKQFLASTLGDAGNYVAAIEIFTQILTKNPKKSSSYFGRAICYDAIESFDKAIDDYNKALEINPYSFEVLYSLGDAYYNNNELKKACKAYEKACDVNPNNADCWFDYARTCFELKFFKKAEHALNKSIQLSPEHSESYYYIGRIELSRDKYDSAVNFFTEACELDYNILPVLAEDLAEEGYKEELVEKIVLDILDALED